MNNTISMMKTFFHSSFPNHTCPQHFWIFPAYDIVHADTTEPAGEKIDEFE
jgi:hypothetical protein